MPQASVDSTVLLASSVHDIKNSLGMLLQTLEELAADMDLQDDAQRRRVGILRGESARINNALISLLGLYRLRESQLPVRIADIEVLEFIEDQLAQNELLFSINNVETVIDCDPDLIGWFDTALVAGALNNVLVNAVKYARSRIEVSARQVQGALEIRVLDDGGGYPPKMLEQAGNAGRGIDFGSGSTNLGLHFAAEIAALHRRDGRTGSIALENPAGGGSCFTLILPS